MTDASDWSSITDLNVDDPLESMIERAEERESGQKGSKRKVGRPKKETRAVPEPEPEPEPVKLREPHPEEQLDTGSLLSMFVGRDAVNEAASKATRKEKSPKKSALRFSMDASDGEEEEDPSRVQERASKDCMLAIHRKFYEEPLVSRHTRPEKKWTPKHTARDIEKENKIIMQQIKNTDPAQTLGMYWVMAMGMAEQVGILGGVPLMGLGEESAKSLKDQKQMDIFRELLIKYPHLRAMVMVGGYPEVMLLASSLTLASEVAESNMLLMRRQDINKDPETAK